MLSTRVLSGYSCASSISLESRRRLPRRTKRKCVFRFACKAFYSLSGSLQRCDQKLANRAFSLTTRCGSSAKLIRSISVTSEFNCEDMDLEWPALMARATKSQGSLSIPAVQTSVRKVSPSRSKNPRNV